jgi:hypothetical protein
MNCEFCNKLCKSKNSLTQHQLRCKENPNRIDMYTLNWTEEKKLKHSLKMQQAHNNSNRIWKPETLANLSLRGKEFNSEYWTSERRTIHSELMKEVVKNNIDSYTTKNVSGRAKIVQYKGINLKGTWELLVAKWLDFNNIEWTNKIQGFEYKWNNRIHLYFPDFYLPLYNKYIEVKGYERERDICKWNDFPNELVVFKLREIDLIKSNKLTKDILRDGLEVVPAWSHKPN